MKGHRVQVVAALALGAFAALATWHVARAYVANAWWPTSSQTYRHHYTLPTLFYSGVSFGASVWTNVSNSSWVWTRTDTSPHTIEYWYIDGQDGALAQTYRNPQTGQLISFLIEFDSSESWWTSSGSPPGDKYDLYSVATHEFGHGLGLDETQVWRCIGLSEPTMCWAIDKGESHWRNLATDDINGLVFLYP